MKVSKNRLKLIFSEVTKGISSMESPLFKKVFIKHLDNHLAAELEILSEKIVARTHKQGLPNLEEKMADLLNDGVWTPKHENEITDIKSFIAGLKVTKSKLFIKAQIQDINQAIDSEENKLNELQKKKKELIGLTTESYAERKVNELFIFHSIYKDRSLETRLFSEDEFEELEGDALSELYRIYNECSQWFSSSTLKQVAVCPLFLNFFYLCEDNPYHFYGKPIADLTFHQSELFGYGRYYKSIFSECQPNIPTALLEDPEKLIEWYDSRNNAQALIDKSMSKENMNVSLVGVSTKELEELGVGPKGPTGKTINLSHEAAKKGGNLSMEDLIRLEFDE